MELPSPGLESGSLAQGANSREWHPVPGPRWAPKGAWVKVVLVWGCRGSLQGLRFTVVSKEMMSLFGVAGACF